ncbi:hypothetical protein J2X69_004014 [Algoriphagus sp. 4150]|uniref:SH3 domain-containing protein n=1 Tax=Algoriphagus sp. 4150 TaxID=2817756 RepID=UPI002860D610|nr:SH3 domain-containing protein [Algoriphagus sp. 4150]MDR7131650.1 hypothetical protein [Algoriphagus sp. 4150]
MSFIGSLAKGFVRSAVNQVGRDGGKVISNSVYQNRHATPIRIVGSINQASINSPSSEYAINSRQDLVEARFQPELLESSAVLYVFIAIGSIILPIVGPVYWLYVSYRNFFKKYTKFYRFSQQPVYVRDRRFKTGQRHDGYTRVKEYSAVAAKPTSSERRTFIIKGIIALLLAVVVTSFHYSWYFAESEPTIEATVDAQPAIGLVKAEHGLNLRALASSNGEVLASIPKDATVEIITQDGPEETIGTKTANWIQVKYGEKLGWVWGGFIEIDSSAEN